MMFISHKSNQFHRNNRSSPNKLITVEECCIFELRELCFKQIDEALYPEISVFVQRQELDTVEDIKNITAIQLDCHQILDNNNTDIQYRSHDPVAFIII